MRAPRHHKRRHLCICINCGKEFYAARAEALWCDTDRCQNAKCHGRKSIKASKEQAAV